MKLIRPCCIIPGFIGVLVVLSNWQVPSCFGQEAPEFASEYDHWRGSSLGIRIERREDQVFVAEVYDYVGDTCPFQSNDRILSIEDTTIGSDDLEELSSLLMSISPDSRLNAVVEREGKETQLSLLTYRRAFVDIPQIVKQLKSNKIIKDHLLKTGRPEYLDTIAERMVESVQQCKSPREAAEGINAIIDEIGVSHTAILPKQSFDQIRGGASGDLGLTLQRHRFDGKDLYFVVDRMPGSSGFDSDVLLGDQIISFNQVPVEKSRRLILSGQEHRRGLFFIQVDVGEVVVIGYRRRQNSGTKVAKLDARESVPAEDVIELSAKVFESGENRYGYMRFWNLMSMKTPGLATKVIDEQFSDCDMLILDIRGRGGLIPAVLALNRVVKSTNVPVIAITDDLTRSAKEMLSLLIKKHPHVTVVGQTTAGAVTGASMMRLPSGNGFMIPVMSANALKRFTDNEVIEGVGVEPDILVDFQIPWCGGNDRLLEAAIQTADDQIQELLENIL